MSKELEILAEAAEQLLSALHDLAEEPESVACAMACASAKHRVEELVDSLASPEPFAALLPENYVEPEQTGA